jgi:hypothetical protein
MPDTAGYLVEGGGAYLLPGSQVLGSEIRCLILQVTWWKGEEQISYQGPRSWARDKMPDTAGDLLEGGGADLLPGPQVLDQR